MKSHNKLSTMKAVCVKTKKKPLWLKFGKDWRHGYSPVVLYSVTYVHTISLSHTHTVAGHEAAEEPV